MILKTSLKQNLVNNNAKEKIEENALKSFQEFQQISLSTDIFNKNKLFFYLHTYIPVKDLTPDEFHQ